MPNEVLKMEEVPTFCWGNSPPGFDTCFVAFAAIIGPRGIDATACGVSLHGLFVICL